MSTPDRGSQESRRSGRRSSRRRILSAASLALLVAAVVQQLRRPPADRDWHGTVARFVPYDLRRPTRARVKASLWAPDDPRLLLPRAFGVGWSPNIPQILQALRDMRPVDE